MPTPLSTFRCRLPPLLIVKFPLAEGDHALAPLSPPQPSHSRCLPATAAKLLLPPPPPCRAGAAALPPPLPSCRHCHLRLRHRRTLPPPTTATTLLLTPPYCRRRRAADATALPTPPSCRRHRAAAKLPPPPRGARGDDGNSLEGRKGGGGVSRAVRGSKRARFFSSGIDLPPAARVRRRRIGYWRIARAGSYKGCIRAPLDSRPLRRYDAASGRAEILELILETAL